MTSVLTVASLVGHWREVGLPVRRFRQRHDLPGTHRYPEPWGRVIRVCLSLAWSGVVPPRETGFQAMIESYNGWWQAKVWSRFRHADLGGLQGCSGRYVAAQRRQRAARIEAAPHRRPFPANWELTLQDAPARPAGLPEADQRPERGDAAGPDVAPGAGVAEPAGPLRGGLGPGQDPLLHAAAQGSDQPAADPGGGLPAAEPGLPGLIVLFGRYWHFSACALFSVREVLALTR